MYMSMPAVLLTSDYCSPPVLYHSNYCTSCILAYISYYRTRNFLRLRYCGNFIVSRNERSHEIFIYLFISHTHILIKYVYVNVQY